MALMLGEGRAPDGVFSLAEGDAPLADAPDVWSDGSLVLDASSGIGIAWCGVYAHVSGAAWFGRMWGHLDLLPPLPDGAGEACRLYCSIPGPLVNHVSRIIAGRCTSKPSYLVTDGDLLLRVQQLVRWRGIDNAAVSEVKGHADEGSVALGRVREVDRIGKNEADAACALGRRRVHHSVTYARGMVTRSCAR